MSTATARQRIVSRFVGAGATSPEAVIAFVPSDAAERQMLRRMRRHDAIVEASPGRYWIDPRALDGFRSAMRRRVAGWVATSGIAATIVAATALTLAE